jgi:preprotein translocase subunit SecY
LSELKDLAFPLYLERRAAVQMAALFAILVVGWHIPLPGLDLDSIPKPYSLLDSAPTLFSIFALDLLPFFTVLAYVEIAKLAVPPLARWQGSSIRNARSLAVIVFVLSLAVAAWQGFGVLLAMSTGTMVRPDAIGFVPAGLATFIGSAALMIWLADNFGLPDLGGGFWPLMALVAIAGFPEQIYMLVNLIQVGQFSLRELLVVVLSLVAGLALVVFANRLLSQNVPAGGAAKTSILLWPSYLAGVVAGQALVLLPNDMPDWPFVAASFVETAYVALVTILIPVFVFAYAGRLLPSEVEEPERWPLPVLLAISAVQMVVFVGSWLLPISLGIPPIIYGGELLVVGTVMLALFTPSSRTPPFPASRRR